MLGDLKKGWADAAENALQAKATAKASAAIEKLENQGPALVALVFELFWELEQGCVVTRAIRDRMDRAETAMMTLRIERDEARRQSVEARLLMPPSYWTENERAQLAEDVRALGLNTEDVLAAKREVPTAPELLEGGERHSEV